MKIYDLFRRFSSRKLVKSFSNFQSILAAGFDEGTIQMNLANSPDITL